MHVLDELVLGAGHRLARVLIVALVDELEVEQQRAVGGQVDAVGVDDGDGRERDAAVARLRPAVHALAVLGRELLHGLVHLDRAPQLQQRLHQPDQVVGEDARVLALQVDVLVLHLE